MFLMHVQNLCTVGSVTALRNIRVSVLCTYMFSVLHLLWRDTCYTSSLQPLGKEALVPQSLPPLPPPLLLPPQMDYYPVLNSASHLSWLDRSLCLWGGVIELLTVEMEHSTAEMEHSNQNDRKIVEMNVSSYLWTVCCRWMCDLCLC